MTTLCQIGVFLNSRPLCPITTDPDDFKVLSPGHFLIGRPVMARPQPSVLEILTNHLSHWQTVYRAFLEVVAVRVLRKTTTASGMAHRNCRHAKRRVGTTRRGQPANNPMEVSENFRHTFGQRWANKSGDN